jgi:hypothetical protein
MAKKRATLSRKDAKKEQFKKGRIIAAIYRSLYFTVLVRHAGLDPASRGFKKTGFQLSLE